MDHTALCSSCHDPIAARDSVHYGSLGTGYRLLCGRCFNELVAGERGLNFEHVQFDPIELPDAHAQSHRFEFRVRHLGDRVALDAFESLAEDRLGYEFQMLSKEPECDLFALLAQLVERMRRTLAQSYLVFDEQWQRWSIKELSVRGRVASDSEEGGRLPLLVIDGREVSWATFGQMLMSFEGWQFKLEMADRSAEL